MEIPQLEELELSHTNSQQIYATPTRNGTTYCRWIIVAISAIAFPPDTTVMYSILSLGVVSLTIDKMMVGLNSSRNLLIISQNSEQILNYITRVADRGSNKIPVLGGHTGHAQNMIMTTFQLMRFQKSKKKSKNR